MHALIVLLLYAFDIVLWFELTSHRNGIVIDVRVREQAPSYRASASLQGNQMNSLFHMVCDITSYEFHRLINKFQSHFILSRQSRFLLRPRRQLIIEVTIWSKFVNKNQLFLDVDLSQILCKIMTDQFVFRSLATLRGQSVRVPTKEKQRNRGRGRNCLGVRFLLEFRILQVAQKACEWWRYSVRQVPSNLLLADK